MPDTQHDPAALPTDASDEIAGQSAATHGAGRGAAAGVTGDNANAGEWPDDIPASRETVRDGGAVAPPTSPQPEQSPLGDDSSDPAISPTAEEDEAAKRGDFARRQQFSHRSPPPAGVRSVVPGLPCGDSAPQWRG